MFIVGNSYSNGFFYIDIIKFIGQIKFYTKDKNATPSKNKTLPKKHRTENTHILPFLKLVTEEKI